jgi:hypothetical protein
LNWSLTYESLCVQPSDAQGEDNQLTLADLETVRVIGKGSGGIVQLVRHKWTNRVFALKVGNFCVMISYLVQLLHFV